MTDTDDPPPLSLSRRASADRQRSQRRRHNCETLAKRVQGSGARATKQRSRNSSGLQGHPYWEIPFPTHLAAHIPQLAHPSPIPHNHLSILTRPHPLSRHRRRPLPPPAGTVIDSRPRPAGSSDRRTRAAVAPATAATSHLPVHATGFVTCSPRGRAPLALQEILPGYPGPSPGYPATCLDIQASFQRVLASSNDKPSRTIPLDPSRARCQADVLARYRG